MNFATTYKEIVKGGGATLVTLLLFLSQQFLNDCIRLASLISASDAFWSQAPFTFVWSTGGRKEHAMGTYSICLWPFSPQQPISGQFQGVVGWWTWVCLPGPSHPENPLNVGFLSRTRGTEDESENFHASPRPTLTHFCTELYHVRTCPLAAGRLVIFTTQMTKLEFCRGRASQRSQNN